MRKTRINIPQIIAIGMLMTLSSSIVFAQSTPAREVPALKLSDSIQAPWVQAKHQAVAQYGIHLKSDQDIGSSLIRELVLYKGEEMIGTQYIYGANDENAVDCSSLVQQMFRSAGVQVPRTTREQIRIGQSVSMDELEPGDLLFYRFGPSGLHVAVYLDDGEVLHASTSQRKVTKSKLTGAWHRKLVTARRRL